MGKKYFLAFDLGASSGRAILGILFNGKLELTEIHRFQNRMQEIDGSFYWNVNGIFNELKTGLKKCINDFGIQPDSIGIDTWGVDYSLIGENGKLLGMPYAYRDHRTDNSMKEFFKLLPEKETYMLSGIQFMQFNTLFQLFASVQSESSEIEKAESMLFIPDTLNYFFTGIKKNEYTIASTSQLLKPGKSEWEHKLFDVADIPVSLVEEIVYPGEVIGTITGDICNETKSKPIPCIAVASHDTASAIASVPAEGNDWAYISSGTWSIMGIESSEPIVNERSLKMNFTNEGGVEGTTRFLKNIMGMWLIQECKRIWDEEEVLDWNTIVEISRKAKPFRSLIDPDDPTFLNPENMPEAIQEFCRKTDQNIPETKGEIARCVYDSLVLKYKFTLDQIVTTVTGKKINKIHIIGGGANNKEMNQLTANATGLPVFAGPTEATSIGNILIQAKGLGFVESLKDVREIVKASFSVVEYRPSPKLDWEAAYKEYCKLFNN